MILVVGATGLVGGEVCRRLFTRGEAVRALVRRSSDPAKVRALRALGIDVMEGDVRDPASLERACLDVSTVVCTVSSMPFAYEARRNDIATTDLDGVVRLVDAAGAADVARFVYTSLSRNLDLEFPLRDAKRTVEAYLRLSGLHFSILRPSFFMDVWLGPAAGFDPAAATATIYGRGEAPISWIAADDVAEFTVRAISLPAARDATIELGGPNAPSPLEVVRIFERSSGRRFDVRMVDEVELRAQEAAATDPMQRSLAALRRCYARGDRIPMANTLAAFDVEPTSVERFAAETIARLPALV